MSKADKLNQREILNEALKKSFRKMLDLKKRLGQPLVVSDGNGNPVVISAEEAEKILGNEQSRRSRISANR